VSYPHPQNPTDEMYFGTVGCTPHPTYSVTYIKFKTYVAHHIVADHF